jgi:hypothetical protein
MKFAVSGDIRGNSALRQMLTAFLGITILFDLLAGTLAWSKGELDPIALRAAIAGSAELFIEPMLFVDILAGMHVSLFLYTFLLLILFSLYLRLAPNDGMSEVWIGTAFLTLILDQGGMLLIRYGSEGWVYTKIVAFFSLHAIILLVASKSLYLLWGRR